VADREFPVLDIYKCPFSEMAESPLEKREKVTCDHNALISVFKYFLLLPYFFRKMIKITENYLGDFYVRII